MKKIILITISTLMFGCSQNFDGTYTAIKNVKSLFTSRSIPITLTINGDKAQMKIPNKRILTSKIKIEDDRMVIDGLIFQMKNDGNTLICNQCGNIDIPKTWERKIN